MLSAIRAADPCAELTQSGEGSWCPFQDQRAARHVASLSTCRLPPALNYRARFQGRDTALPPLITLLLSSREELCQGSRADWCLGWTVPKSRLYVCRWVLWIKTYSYCFLLACFALSSFFLQLTVVSCPVLSPGSPGCHLLYVIFAQRLPWSPCLKEMGGKGNPVPSLCGSSVFSFLFCWVLGH